MQLCLTTVVAVACLSVTPVGWAQAQTLPDHNATRDAAGSDMLGAAPERELSKALQARITSGQLDEIASDEFAPGVARALRHAYAQGNFRPLFTPEGARAFRTAARDLTSHGLVIEDVFSRDLDDLVEARTNGSTKARAKADTQLALAALRAARTLSDGLGDQGGMDAPDTDGPMQSVLTDYLGNVGQGRPASAMMAFAPKHPQYGALRKALSDYREIERAGGWAAIPDGDIVERGESDARISAVRTRLAQEGFTVPAPEGDVDVLDAGLEAAIKTFQARHGLEPDGVVGPATLEAMNESVESKVARIAESLHRWRRHGDLGERYVLANIPSYTAEGWNGGEREIRMKTVVGKPVHATPTFSDEIEYIVANPKWYVPTSIARRQKLPKLRKDATYAPRHNYQVIDKASGEAVPATSVDWQASDVLSRYRLVQQPGESNALGTLKIIFPNQYSVYLHDTPTEHLFDRAQRAFSSGCVRLEKPEAMARWVAGDDDNTSARAVSEQLDSGERGRLYLGDHVPVHITYHTVTVNDAGEAVFHRDVYDRLDDIEAVKRMAKLDAAPRSFAEVSADEGAAP